MITFLLVRYMPPRKLLDKLLLHYVDINKVARVIAMTYAVAGYLDAAVGSAILSIIYVWWRGRNGC